MGTVGFAALLANAASFGLLWAYRAGDANMRSAWIAPRTMPLNSRRAACRAGVFGTGSGWPDIAVAAIMAALAARNHRSETFPETTHCLRRRCCHRYSWRPDRA